MGGVFCGIFDLFIVEMSESHKRSPAPPELIAADKAAALAGLAAFKKRASLAIPAAYRLAFRELGLAIGLKGIMPLRDWAEKSNGRTASQTPLQRKFAALLGYLPLAGEIEDFWLEERNSKAGTWREHQEINMVMLATTLAPDGFLSI